MDTREEEEWSRIDVDVINCLAKVGQGPGGGRVAARGQLSASSSASKITNSDTRIHRVRVMSRTRNNIQPKLLYCHYILFQLRI